MKKNKVNKKSKALEIIKKDGRKEKFDIDKLADNIIKVMEVSGVIEEERKKLFTPEKFVACNIAQDILYMVKDEGSATTDFIKTKICFLLGLNKAHTPKLQKAIDTYNKPYVKQVLN